MAKTREGDHKTPEGNCIIVVTPTASCTKNCPSLTAMLEIALMPKVVGVAPGGAIMIRGNINGLGWIGGIHRPWNWSDGCVAVTNSEIDEIWNLVSNGKAIAIRP